MDSFFYCVFVLNVWNSLHSSSLYNQPPACRSETLAGLQPGAARTQRSTPCGFLLSGPSVGGVKKDVFRRRKNPDGGPVSASCGGLDVLGGCAG